MKKHTEDEVIDFIADIIGTGLPVEESVTAAISFVCLAKADLQKMWYEQEEIQIRLQLLLAGYAALLMRERVLHGRWCKELRK